MKSCRNEIKMTAKEVADAIGVKCVDTIYSWEAGKTFPTAPQMVKLLNLYADKGFNVTLDEINFLC